MTRPSEPHSFSGLAGALALTLVAGAFYLSYLDSGFNVADDGHYAQVAFELWLGADPHAIRFGYGIAWFKLGEAMFQLTGPSYHWVHVLFFAFLAATAGLIFATVHQITRNPWVALLAGTLVAVVPAFPPTAFYGFCAAINMLAQVRLAQRWRRITALDVAPAALALAVTFQIRPDFGYAFAIPFGLLLLAGALSAGLARLVGWIVTALAVFLVAHAPLIIGGLIGGYLDLVIADYLRYPELLARLVLAGVTRSADTQAAAGVGTLLARPPLESLWLGPPAVAAQAFVVHAPVVGLIAFALYQASAPLRRSGQAGLDQAVMAATLLLGALASFPHYFLFRPDLTHVANFMPGYTVLATVFAWWLAGGESVGGRRPERPGVLAVLAAAALIAGLGGYAWVGLTTPGTGSIAMASGRERPFVADNGVDVRVNEGERRVFAEIHRQITEHARPDEAIVCVPFCPGVAFMTARRMLLGEFYVDDSLLASDPGWIERAIARTREARAPVVVVFDWALNGTDISRFQVWAKPYLDFLTAAGYRRVDMGAITIYLREG